MYDAVALGEILVDFAMQGEGTEGFPILAAHPGGAPGNFLAAMSRCGKRTAMIGKVGADKFGELLCSTLERAGVEIQGVLRDAEVFTTLAFVTFDAHGDRSFSFARKPGADTCLRFEEVELALVEQAKVFHFGTLSLTDEPAREATVRTVAYAKAHGKLITFDPNLRKPLWPSEQAAREQILWGLHQADVVKISDEEVDFLWGCTPEEGAEHLLNEFGVKLAMVTMGPEGCYLKNRTASCRTKGPEVHPVDTTGAGDIFGGCAVSRILELGKDPARLNREELLYVARFAATAASLSTQSPGGIPSIPDVETVLSYL